MSKNKKNFSGIVYSTNPDFSIQQEDDQEENTLEPAEQKIKIRLETKHRAGKTVTLLEGFIGTAEDREDLVKKLKNHCGSGGSAKDGEMLIQGDHREKILQWLLKNGYRQAKKQ